MYIFFILSIIILIIGIIFFIIGFKKERQDLLNLTIKKQDFLENQLKDLKKQCKDLEQERQQLEIKRDATARERKVETERLEELKAQARQVLLSERERLDAEIDLARKLKMQQLEQEYESKKQSLQQDYENREADYNKKIDECTNTLYQFKQMQEAINEATRRQKELIEQEEFYTIDVSPDDQEDILVLQSMDMKLHNRNVIPKLIWELFIRRPTQEMIKRVVGKEKASGIYKITYKKTGEAYIGKTTDFSTRWQNHIKTAIGLEAAARATLHNRMAKDGIWNYTFEILERVDKEFLSSRESYYIDLYGTKNQLNMKSGDKNGTQ